VFGEPLFIIATINEIFPKLNQDSFSKVSLKHHLSGKLGFDQHLLDKYDVVQIHDKYLRYIDLDEWFVATKISSTKLVANMYAHKDIVANLHNNHHEINKTNLVMHEYDLRHNITNYIVNGKRHKFIYENIKYIVDTDMQKKIILKIGFLPEVYSAEDIDQIDIVEGVTVEFEIKPSVVLVNKKLENSSEVISLYRHLNNNVINYI
jgi:hypothetical protein